MNILVVDDHDVVRQSLGMIIHSEYPRAIVVKVENADQCTQELKKSKFDLLILDMNLPDLDGISLTEWIFERYPNQSILIFSMNPAGVFAGKLYEMGVMGYLNKPAPMSEIRLALRTILSDKKKYIGAEFKPILASVDAALNPFDKLSKRELIIAQYLARGRSFEEISQQLSIESSTARTYKARIFQKLEVSNMHEFLSKAELYKLI